MTAYIAPGSLWGNGYAESFNGRFLDEFLNRALFTTAQEAPILSVRFRWEYAVQAVLGSPEAYATGGSSIRSCSITIPTNSHKAWTNEGGNFSLGSPKILATWSGWQVSDLDMILLQHCALAFCIAVMIGHVSAVALAAVNNLNITSEMVMLFLDCLLTFLFLYWLSESSINDIKRLISRA